ncbi:50S ribosomal protein L10 [Candidatus Woesearchaeota archaeon]|nr:50S ribosomal protein L10 [Candidatus Woesearchaeota archaeon]
MEKNITGKAKGKPEAHVAGYKKKVVDNLLRMLQEYPVVAAINMENLPAGKLGEMRASIRGKIHIAMTKKRLISIALHQASQSGQGAAAKSAALLLEHLKGMPALIFTKLNPFALFKLLKKSKSKAPAKAGQVAPYDLIAQKGPTPFAPGPIIGELAIIGVKSGVEGGKVVIKEDSLVAKAGETITQKKAEVLTRLGIEPMEVGLNITAVLEDGQIYSANVLDIDEKQFLENVMSAAREAFNLSCAAAFPLRENITVLLTKAFMDAKTLGIERSIIDEGIVEELLARAEGSAIFLQKTANIAVPEKEKTTDSVSQETAPQSAVPPVSAAAEPAAKESAANNSHAQKAADTKEPAEKGAKSGEQKSERRQEQKHDQKNEGQNKDKPREETRREASPREGRPKEIPLGQDIPITTETKVKELVDKAHQFSKGEIPNAEKLVEEAGRSIEEAGKSAANEALKVQEPKMPTAQEIFARRKAIEASELKQQEVKKVEQLTRDLLKKGTLRK